jgi:gamma-butyrobetaine dioxygenase
VVQFDLRAGDYLVYDNHRMMHGRTAFTGTQRFLRGIYLDKKEVFAFLDKP